MHRTVHLRSLDGARRAPSNRCDSLALAPPPFAAALGLPRHAKLEGAEAEEEAEEADEGNEAKADINEAEAEK